jgi:L-malate glycosyltransferase
MRILLLSTAVASHTVKWARSLSKSNEVLLFSLPEAVEGVFDNYRNLIVKSINVHPSVTTNEGFKGKYKYISALSELKKIIKDFKPDLLHAHYATSYGLLGSLMNFHPYILSVWGSDVYDFPKKSIIHRKLIEFNLRKADVVMSTSHAMALETQRYTDKQIYVTPFGIDVEKFKNQTVENIFEKGSIVIGTIKTLEKKYGVDYLLKSFALVRDKYTSLKLKLLIVGGGKDEESLKKLSKKLGIHNDTVFTGRINYDEIVGYYNMLDIYVAVSILDSESFGVAVLEASSCEKPVIVSRVGGLPEVVENNVTGIVVDPKSIEGTADAIEKLILNEPLRKHLGINGRKRIIEKYNWDSNVSQMLSIYHKVINKRV